MFTSLSQCPHSYGPRLSSLPAGAQQPPPPLTFISEHDQDQKLNKPHVVRHSYGFPQIEMMSHQRDQRDQQGANQR